MHAETSRPAHAPYGAFELKQTYQRNIMRAWGVVATLTLATVFVLEVLGENRSFQTERLRVERPEVGVTPHSFKQPTSDPIVPDVRRGPTDQPTAGIPVPVPDSAIHDQDETTKPVEDAQSRGQDGPTTGAGSDGDGPSASGTTGDDPTDYIPSPDSFIVCELYPEMICQGRPEYPRLAIQAGLEGRVIVQVLVSETGEVLKAQVAVSSEIQSLDESAIAAAYKNKFKPAIQNGKPIKLWVTYDVEFKLSS